jgi:hypothetical protein
MSSHFQHPSSFAMQGTERLEQFLVLARQESTRYLG